MMGFTAATVWTAVASSAGVVTYGSQYDDVSSGADSFGDGPVGTVAAGAGTAVWPAIGGGKQGVLRLYFQNTDGGQAGITITLKLNGTALLTFTIQPLGSAVFDGVRAWRYDQYGVLQ